MRPKHITLFMTLLLLSSAPQLSDGLSTQKVASLDVVLQFEQQESVWGLYRAKSLILDDHATVALDYSISYGQNPERLHFILHSAMFEAGGMSTIEVIETEVLTKREDGHIILEINNNEHLEQIHHHIIAKLQQTKNIRRIRPRSLDCFKENRPNSSIECRAQYTAHIH